MKKAFLFITMLPLLSFSQEKEILHYFKSRDSLVGVKNLAGKIIVPAQFKIFSDLKDGDPVQGETILFDGSKKGEEQENLSWGYVYDRKGNFLYTPFLYDNGPDYFVEGLRRFVKNGKIGFVDRNGKIVIEPQHGFATYFNYGYASFCDGCKWEKGQEGYKEVVGEKWGIMNTKGETVQPLTKYSENDVKIVGEYYPYPFLYNEKEKSILQFFDKQNKKLADLYYVNVYNKIPEKEKRLFFEIVERPKENFPYYQVNTYDYTKYDLGMLNRFKFLVSEDGKTFYTIEDYNEKKIPFEEWLGNEIKEAKQFQKEHPDNPNKLNNNLN